ncbi:DUF3883 domain-containing protein [Curtobacterium sp. HSID17257]|nr:DUF3883 domain-containing protein [Curtobacterium sp. HSID17257]
MSRGGTVKSDFLDRISEALLGSSTNQEDTYRKAEFVLSGLGETYDPWWDTSEAQGPTGGGTVTTRAYSRIRANLAREQRCFAVPGSVAAGREESHTFNGRPHRIPLAEAGPGSNLLFFEETSDGYVATGVGSLLVTAPGWTDPWKIQWTYRPFETPLVFDSPFGLPSGVFEISVASFESFGTATAELESTNSGRAEAAIAERLTDTYKVDDVRLNSVAIPPRSDVGGPIAALTEVAYTEQNTGALKPAHDAPTFRRPQNRALSREIERRGVQLAHRALTEDGWLLERDCQKDGVGYDFVYLKNGRRIHVEVKGIQGTRIDFNLTPKEWWRALTDEDWLLVTVTNALSPAQSTISVFTGNQVRAAPRSVVSYRLAM